MKVYQKLVIDLATDTIVEEQWEDYSGPLELAIGGGGSKSESKPTYVLPSLLPEIASAAKTSIIGPASGQPTTIGGTGGGGYRVPMSLTDINMQRAVNAVRGGYGARGLAGSGIAQQGESEAIGQLALQGEQQAATNLTNLLSAGMGQTSQQKQSTGISVICTELNRQGLLPDDVFRIDTRFGLKQPADVLRGYWLWAIPLTNLMKRSRLATKFAAFIALPWAYEMAGVTSWRGRVLVRLGVPFCGWLGKTFCSARRRRRAFLKHRMKVLACR